MRLPVLRHDLLTLLTYHYRQEPPLAVPMTVLFSAEDPFISRGVIEKWRPHTTKGFEVQEVRGSHFFLAAALETVRAKVTS
jgi:medium-chain acyl-[acyl-carrier-protein] hydrolase